MEDSRKAWLRKHFPSGPFIAVAALVGGALAGIVVYVGAYDIGADSPHTRPVYWLIEQLRDRSIAVRARNVGVPANLTDMKRLQSGAGLYTEMCSGCHLAPGLEKSEISQGLYPKAPELFREPQRSPREQFWIIKHGVKLTAMPAWGKTHSDELIWDMVAFVRQLPKMTPAQYQAALASAPEDHDAMMKDMPGMKKMMP
ncbi:c-type cytochrome [Sphingobium sp. Cam5-1]|jgi:mono/diheme cytochrome c family protein|uniref:c-type cytochrome n=1 Tax=Sphingobium sp. Cam5-1 TaxID=2789327 RepID=UPI0018AD2953|nr:cytochrome c [Sphingobium sp. Cam5-1]QPI75769.1 cytochrome c [Sphingobium sp. Cam5-1]